MPIKRRASNIMKMAMGCEQHANRTRQRNRQQQVGASELRLQLDVDKLADPGGGGAADRALDLAFERLDDQVVQPAEHAAVDLDVEVDFARRARCGDVDNKLIAEAREAGLPKVRITDVNKGW
eukprot:SAG31_NODE_27438_length_426_cov_0.709480_1_plen_122_part_01